MRVVSGAERRGLAVEPIRIRQFPLFCLNVVYVPYLLIVALSFGLFASMPALAWNWARGGRLGDTMRLNNQRFGAFILRMSGGLLRIRRRGLENMRGPGPCVIVVNHRSFADIFFCGLIPKSQIVVFVRSWPFRLWPLGWFMRAAEYVDLEREPLERWLERRGRELCARGVSFLFFPEGHRSRDGRLQRFRAGAFIVADALNLPLAPVCLSGTEAITRGGGLIHPARITLEVLPAVQPDTLPAEGRALALRKEVERIYREYYHED